jgi:hypothetical protein
MYSIRKSAAGRRIGIIGMPAVLPPAGRSGLLVYTLSGSAFIFASAMMYGFGERRRERRFK